MELKQAYLLCETFFLIVKIEFKNKSNMLFFQEVSTIACKTKSSITSTSRTQMEWIKAFYVKEIIIYENCKKFGSRFFRLFCCQVSPISNLLWHNFCSSTPIETKLIFLGHCKKGLSYFMTQLEDLFLKTARTFEAEVQWTWNF